MKNNGQRKSLVKAIKQIKVSANQLSKSPIKPSMGKVCNLIGQMHDRLHMTTSRSLKKSSRHTSLRETRRLCNTQQDMGLALLPCVSRIRPWQETITCAEIRAYLTIQSTKGNLQTRISQPPTGIKHNRMRSLYSLSLQSGALQKTERRVEHSEKKRCPTSSTSSSKQRS